MLKGEIFKPKLALESDTILLRPIAFSDAKPLMEAGSPSIWEYMSVCPVTLEDWEESIRQAANDREAEKVQELVVYHKPSGTVIGATSILNISERDSRLEVGRSWITETWQGKRINREVKRLVLTFLFEIAKVNRIEFMARTTNVRSQRALKKLGVKEEGTLRNWIYRKGSFIDVSYFSILASEWAAVKEQL